MQRKADPRLEGMLKRLDQRRDEMFATLKGKYAEHVHHINEGRKKDWAEFRAQIVGMHEKNETRMSCLVADLRCYVEKSLSEIKGEVREQKPNKAVHLPDSWLPAIQKEMEQTMQDHVAWTRAAVSELEKKIQEHRVRMGEAFDKRERGMLEEIRKIQQLEEGSKRDEEDDKKYDKCVQGVAEQLKEEWRKDLRFQDQMLQGLISAQKQETAAELSRLELSSRKETERSTERCKKDIKVHVKASLEEQELNILSASAAKIQAEHEALHTSFRTLAAKVEEEGKRKMCSIDKVCLGYLFTDRMMLD